MNLSANVKVTLVTPYTAIRCTTIAATTLDMSGFDGVMFVLGIHTLTGTARRLREGIERRGVLTAPTSRTRSARWRRWGERGRGGDPGRASSAWTAM